MKTAFAYLACLAAIGLALTGPVRAEALKPLKVKTARLVHGDITRYVTLPGGLRANQQVTLYAKVGGYLKSLTVERGDRVRAGQVLGEIEVPELLSDLSRHKAKVKVAEADFRRVSAAQAKAPDLVPAQTVDEARGRLEIAQAELERVEILLKYAQVTAPFGGIVTARYLDPGAFVPAATSGSAAQTAAIVTIADFSIVRATVALPEAEASMARVGQPVAIGVEGLPGKICQGQINRLSYALDENTRTMLIEVDLPNTDLALRPGMYATARVGLESHTNALLLPAEALVLEKTAAFVFTAESDKAKKRPIKTGFNDGKSLEVLSGLAGGERVILTGKQPLTDGAAVNPVEVK